MSYTDGEWEARQQAIKECTADLAEVFKSKSQSWQQLLELAELYYELTQHRRNQ